MPELCFVAQVKGELAGSVVYSRSKVLCGGKEHEVITFGPLSVLPKFQSAGVGKALMAHSINEARRLGHRAIITYGHPDYYPRFGFQNAGVFGITSPSGKNFDALFALPLYHGALDGITGAFYEDEAFKVDPEAAKEFDKRFPPKEPMKMTPLGVLLDRLPERARKSLAAKSHLCLERITEHSGRELLELDGFNLEVLGTVNQVLKDHNLPEKLLPTSYILQLAKMGVWLPESAFLRDKAGIALYRVSSEGNSYILKVFANMEDRREIANYKLLASLGVPTLPMIKHTDCALLLPDLEFDPLYRTGRAEDLNDPDVARALGRWYRLLHEKGRELFKSQAFDDIYDWTDILTLENMEFTAEKTNSRDNPLWPALRDRFTELRRRVDGFSRTLAYNDFWWTNLAVARDKSSAMMLDFNLMGRGYAYGDIRNVTSALSKDCEEIFTAQYGPENISPEEQAADAVLSHLHGLYTACRRKNFPDWAKESLEGLRNGVILEKLLDWLG